ncbi:MAG TPA: LptF/LptG family permease [Gemmatales bacterium]|nr:LptF/LptG family permease [Gemmatales bacterium]
MLTLLDRYLLKHFVFAYLATFISVLTMYMVIDVFAKFDEFAAPDPAKVALKEQRAAEASTTGMKMKRGKPVIDESRTEQLKSFCRNVFVYYINRIPVFFQRINGIILLLAGAFTLGWMDRQNEVMPFLAAGVPIRRLLMPIGGVIVFFLLLGVLDTELVIPHCADQLLRQAEDPLGKRPLLVPGTFDERHIHIEARVAYPHRQMIQHAKVTLPIDIFGNTVHIHCLEMFYHPGNGPDDHGWIMNGCTPAKLPGNHPAIRELQPGQFFLHTELTYTRITRRPNWFLYQATNNILEVLENEQGMSQRAMIIGHVHQRILMPLYDLLLLLLGLPLMASRSEWNIFVRVGWCLLIFTVIQGLGMGTSMMVKSEMIDPALAAWLPLLVIGPLVPPVIAGMRT